MKVVCNIDGKITTANMKFSEAVKNYNAHHKVVADGFGSCTIGNDRTVFDFSGIFGTKLYTITYMED